MPIIYQIFLSFFFLFFAYLAHKDIKNGIYAVIFLLPIYLLRFTLSDIPTTALEIIIYILFFLWLIKNRKNLDIRKSVSDFFRNDKILAVGTTLLFFGVILSTIHSSDLRTSLGVLKGWFVDPFLFFLVFIDVIKNQKQIVILLRSLILSGFAVALVSIGYALSDILTFDGRLRAIYESPNYLAMYLSPAFLFAVYLFIFQKGPLLSFRTEVRNPSVEKNYYNVCLNAVKRFFFSPLSPQNNKKGQAIILLSLAVVLLLTKSYGAILGIAVALFCFSLKRYQNRSTKLFSDNKKTLTVLAVVALALFSFLSFQKYEQLLNAGERSSLASRFMIWDASREMLEDSPIFGIGPGTFQKTYLDYQSRFTVPYLEWAVPQPHNTLLAFYLQSGLIGLVGFVLILFWLCKRAKASDIVFIFLIYFLIHGLVDTLYWKNDLAMVFWLVVGVGFLDKKKFNSLN